MMLSDVQIKLLTHILKVDRVGAHDCLYPTFIRRVVSDGKYWTSDRDRLLLVRADYIKWLNSQK